MMKRFTFFIALVLLSIQNFAHAHHEGPVKLRTWNIPARHQTIEGSFLMMKNGEIYIEDSHNEVVHFPIAYFSSTDRDFAFNKYKQIGAITHAAKPISNGGYGGVAFEIAFVLAVLFSLILLTQLIIHQHKNRLSRQIQLTLSVVLAFALGMGMKNGKLLKSTTDPLAIDSAFAVFKPAVYTRWDNQYFYVESKGIPAHPMMLGIRSWQQQVPIPQCYINNNPWSIPLNPVVAASPVPVSPQHFLRGAIAIAVNGVAIFNPYTNTGVDAFLDGQLDSFGGHCGRADDYHYHTAPLVLYNQTPLTKPIAYALDGFAVYGPKEPDGRNMLSLDTNHGHYFAGVYHYHGTNSAPYMIGNMVGEVTEDTTLQIIPQASAKGVRPSLTPLKGAFINSCIPKTSGNGYVLNYTLNNQSYSVDYFWNNTGNYTFQFISPSGTSTNQYNGFIQCSLPAVSLQNLNHESTKLLVYPNPGNKYFQIAFEDVAIEKQVEQIQIYDRSGRLVYQHQGMVNQFDLSGIAPGTYILRVQTNKAVLSKKLLIQ